MKRFCIILSFSLVILISFSCSRKSEIATADTVATDLDSKSTGVVKTPVNTPVFSVTETKTFRELGLLTPESQAKYLKLSLNDFKEMTQSWSPEALLDLSVVDFAKTIQTMAQLTEVGIGMAVSIASPPATEEQILKNWKNSDNETEKQAYNNIILFRRVMKAWGL